MTMDAGDAVIFVPARTIIGGDEMRVGLVLARPWNDAAGIVAMIDLRRCQRASEHNSKKRKHKAHGECLRNDAKWHDAKSRCSLNFRPGAAKRHALTMTWIAGECCTSA